MWLDALLATLHWLAIGGLAATLFAEWLLLRWQIPLQQPARLSQVDLFYFLAALAALVTGLLRLFFGAKGVSFYTGQPVFWLKISLYVVVGLISLAPTQRFTRWRKGSEAVTSAGIAAAQRLVSLQLLLLLGFPLLASAMARAVFS